MVRAAVDRAAVVRRHTVVLTGVDPASALQVGNGEIAMAVDVTGVQTFPDLYPVDEPTGGPPGTLLGTQSQWGWHSTPRPAGADLDATRRRYRTPRGDVLYVDADPQDGSDDSALDAGVRWLRANPHRLDLGRLGLVVAEGDGWRAPTPDELTDPRQELDLWTGVLTSHVTLAGRRLRVTTACHPEHDAFAVRVEPLRDGVPVALRLAFAYGSQAWARSTDDTRPGAHVTDVVDGTVVHRRFDGAHEATHTLRLTTTGRVVPTARHTLVVLAGGPLDLVVAHTPGGSPGPALHVDDVLAAARRHWPGFWERGAALDLADATDPRAPELERRVVLSQYLTAVQCAGSLPPQETGLGVSSWRGRFHLEMHWWHAAHFALWGRGDLLERSMGFYVRTLPAARATAALQGYAGARWPKQVGPDARESPSEIGPFLLWQQPHPLHLAELLRRAARHHGGPTAARVTAARYADVVDATARFMADVVEPTPAGYALGPPLVPAQESYAAIRARATNPPFELASWAWGLGLAQEWRRERGLRPEPRWDEVRRGLVPPPVHGDAYAAIGVPPWTVRTDHPSVVYGLGVVPDTGYLDRARVAATLADVRRDWDWASTWGWDPPALAMTAARLGDRDAAVDLLLADTPKNGYVASGHNRQTPSLPVYLPGNGGLLAAVALMVGGWDGSGHVCCPGLPEEGWRARHEGFVPAP